MLLTNNDFNNVRRSGGVVFLALWFRDGVEAPPLLHDAAAGLVSITVGVACQGATQAKGTKDHCGTARAVKIFFTSVMPADIVSINPSTHKSLEVYNNSFQVNTT